ncbi:MAG: hypothetical protein RIB58_10985 [Phycisphaerales bacterium]
MACAPALPAEFADQPDLNDARATQAKPAPARRRRCGRAAPGQVAKKQPAHAAQKLATRPHRGMAIVMGAAATLSLVVAMLQLADGQAGQTAAETLYLAAGFNVLFTLLYAPLLALLTLRTGFFKALGALVCTFFTGLAATLGLLFISAVLLVALSSVFAA